MKSVIVVVCYLNVLARASLEPLSYRLPGSYSQSNYLAPSSTNAPPDSRYVPSPGSGSRTTAPFDNQLLSTGLSLPSENSPMLFVEYLPANRDHDDRVVSAIDQSNSYENSRTDSQHSRPDNDQRIYVHSIPPSDLVAPTEHRVFDTSNAYLGPNVQSDESSDRYSGQIGSASTGQYPVRPTNVHRPNKIHKENGGHYESNHDERYSNSGSSGYHYGSSGNHIPVKYEFGYKVKDNNGNDYGHKEERNGESTRGFYAVLLPDGRRQIVHYEADSHGYRPTITYEEAGSHFGSDKQGYQY